MDPSRVDGLARVLETAARDRQVVVFTHDDRLPEAVRRLGIAATVIEVTRREGSAVEVREGPRPGGALYRGCDGGGADGGPARARRRSA